jgi:hypothetical protein
MANIIYNSALKKISDADIDFASDTIKVALLSNLYTPNRDSHDFLNDVNTNEITAVGYTTGGATLSGVTTTQDNSGDLCKIDANDVSWTITGSLTARYAVIYKSTGVASTSALIALIDFGTDKSVVDNTFTITWSASGIITVKQA